MAVISNNFVKIGCFILILIQIGEVQPRIIRDLLGRVGGVLGTVENATKILVYNTENILNNAVTILQDSLVPKLNFCDAKTVNKYYIEVAIIFFNAFKF